MNVKVLWLSVNNDRVDEVILVLSIVIQSWSRSHTIGYFLSLTPIDEDFLCEKASNFSLADVPVYFVSKHHYPGLNFTTDLTD